MRILGPLASRAAATAAAAGHITFFPQLEYSSAAAAADQDFFLGSSTTTLRALQGSFSSVAVHDMGLPRNAQKGHPTDPGEENLEEAILVYFTGF